MKIYWIKAQAPRRVLALVKHLGLKAEFVEVGLMAGGLKSPEFAALNPNMKAPVLVDGEPVGAINRVPQAGETRSNMHVGGRPEKIGLTARDLEICARIGPVLREKGQVFVGIDVIGDWLTEINVTSPTGLQELERFDGTNAAERIWQVIEAKRAGM